MNELSERSKKVGKLAYWKAFEYAERPDNGVLEIADLIEQALLAERQDVWAAAIKAVKGYKSLSGLNRSIAITALRAAAEKEVGK